MRFNPIDRNTEKSFGTRWTCALLATATFAAGTPSDAGRTHPGEPTRFVRALAVPEIETRAGEPEPIDAPASALTAIDLDEDGTPDLIRLFRDGTLTVQAGNTRAIYPWLPGETDEPFLARARRFHAGAVADWLGAGDFNADGHYDLVVAARDGNELRWLRGNGKGELHPMAPIALDGSLTAFAIGEIGRRDGLEDLVLGLAADLGSSADEGRVLIFRSPNGALTEAARSFSVPAPPEHLLPGHEQGSALFGVAIAAGSELWILPGRERFDDERIDLHAFKLPAAARTIVTAARSGGWAIETADGQWVKPEVREATDPGAGVLHVVTIPSHVAARQFRDSPGTYAAVLPLRIGPDAADSLILMDETGAVSALTRATRATFSVINTADAGAGSLRQAILDANSFPGADTIVFNIPGPVPHSIVPLTPLPLFDDPVTLDATTQPGYSGAPLVQLDGSVAGLGAIGLGFNSGSAGSTVRGLSIYKWSFGIRFGLSPDGIVEACRFGIDSAGNSVGGGAGIGVEVGGTSHRTRIGGTTAAARNLFGGLGVGIRSDASDLNGVVISGNYIGTDPSGSIGYPIANQGILFSATFGVGSTNHTIGGTAAGAGNVVSSAGSNGIELSGAALSGVLVQGNRCGTDAAGAAAIPSVNGVSVRDTRLHTIGGTTPAAANLLSGNLSRGILVQRVVSPTDSILIQGNRIGTDITGLSPLPNVDGILVTEPDVTIGGLAAGAGNRISGNSRFGIYLFTGGNRTIVQGNQIGLSADGTGLANGNHGILLSDVDDALIGGTSESARNVISGNGASGIQLQNGSANAAVEGNYIGVDPTASFAVPNSVHGISVLGQNPNLQIGLSGDPVLNVISGNGEDGIAMLSAADAIVRGNIVGGGPSPQDPIPNQSAGIRLTNSHGIELVGNNYVVWNGTQGIVLSGTSHSNRVVGNSVFWNSSDGLRISADGTETRVNYFYSNGAAAVRVLQGSGNRISANRMYENGELGIDLGGDLITANDGLDADTGPNELQNFPVVSTASYCAGQMAVQGLLESTPDTTFEIETFATECDPSGHGEASVLAGGLPALSDPAGGALFSGSRPVLLLPTPQSVVTTATEQATGSTSEFSACVQIADGRPLDGLELRWSTPTQIQWHAVANAESYRLYRGLSADLSGFPSGALTALLRWFGDETATGDVLSEDPPPGEYYWWVVRARNGCGEGGAGSMSDTLRSVRSVGSVSNCAHDRCSLGLPLAADCDPCVAKICELDPFCCNNAWDDACVDQTLSVCDDAACGANFPTCPHALCEPGVALAEGCDTPPLFDSCVTAVCEHYPLCCSSAWSEYCATLLLPVCGLTCD